MKINENANRNRVTPVVLSVFLVTMICFSLTADAEDLPLPESLRNGGDVETEGDSNPTQIASSGFEKAVTSVLRVQQKAWNRGDIAGFMKHYWKSKKLTFSTGGTTKRGWKATFARYRKRYPNRETMGKLTFNNLEVTALGEKSALVLGEWHLKRKNDHPEGVFSLVMRNIEGRWLIVHDHTSSKPIAKVPQS